MRKCLLIWLMAIALATPAAAAAWTRGYVVTNYEPAWHFGGSATFHKAGILQPGSDCPGGTYPDIDYGQVLTTPWRDAAAVQKLLHPPHTDPDAVIVLQARLLTYRGFRDGIDVYLNPFSAPDPGMREVTGRIAEGFDLDSNPKTGGFTGPDGERGIDNAFYRAWGCFGTYRDEPYHGVLSRRGDDQMAVEGLYTFVIRLSGNKDPMNDDDATLEIGFSPDHMTIGGDGNVLGDYSFRLIKSNAEYSKLKAVIRNGVVESAQVDELHAPRMAWYANQFGDADFHKGKMRFSTDAAGHVSGLIGGYRDWRELFVEHHFSQTGGHEEQRDHVNSMAMYYALKRNADGMPDPKTRRDMGISIAYRFKALPAFIVDSDKPAPTTVTITANVAQRIRDIEAHRAAFYKALATRQIQPLPPGSHEGADNLFDIVALPDGSWKLVPVPLLPNVPAPPGIPNADQRQVLNIKSVTEESPR